MSKDACEFMENVRRGQRRFWLTLLLWWVCVAVFVAVVSQLFKNAPDAVFMTVFYGSALLLYVPAYRLYRLKCPYCDGSAGALPFLRYKFLFCRACGERLECLDKHSH